MNIKNYVFVLLLLSFYSCNIESDCLSSKSDVIEYVNPFIGTGGHGHTYPGAVSPFGAVQLSPDTRLTGWDGCGGYHYSDDVIFGFSHTHLSGTGVSDYGDILFMPVSGDVMFDNGKEDHVNGYASAFSHDNETAFPGFYRVLLDDYNIDVELTATQRAGFHKYTSKSNDAFHVILDLMHRDKVISSSLKILNDSTIVGSRLSKAWASEQHIYFYVRFSKPFLGYSINNTEKQMENNAIEGVDIKAAFDFNIPKGENILLKIGVSAVDIEGAKKNLDKEIPDWDFDNTVKRVQNDWRKELSKVIVEDDDNDAKTIFYTALYHSFLNPNIYIDVDGRYRGRDLKIHKSDGFDNYTVFSLWDTFRATHPLFTILQQKRTNDFINTFLRQYEQGGRLPVWELAANETDCMIGYHSVPVIVDAFVKGIRDYDSELALKAMLNSANEDRYGLKYYKSLGYIPASEEGESVSKTLEYAYDDWCIAEFAKKMGDADTYHKFIERGQYWKNLYDPSTRFMRAKMGAGWFSPFDAREVNFNYTEANAWQYNFFVPHDVITMVDYMGGDKSFARFLDKLFTENASTTGRTQSDITGLIGQYAHGNEPSHHMAYLYSYVDEPWNTQKYVKRIMNELYSNRPDGLCGNEDCGQMSSWYVLSAMGFYSVTPGMDYYTLGSPMFDRVTINLENGNSFIIEANDNDSENVFVESVLLNGKKYDKSFINHSDIMNGGSFVFNMTDTPQKDCFKQSPVSVIDTSVIIPVPYIKEGAMTFKKSTEVVLECMSVDAEILYTIDGSDPIEEGVVYSRPIVVSSTTIVKAVAKQGNRISKEIKAHFALIPVGRSIKIEGEYANQYSAGGDNALIDGLRGGDDFKTGLWQGYQAQDVDVVIDLGDEKVYNKISIGFLQDMKSWIMMPEMVSFYISDDGKKFRKVGVEKNRVLLKEEGAVVHDFGIEKNMKSRYVKIVANNIGVLPTWHLGAGHDAWLFADEIIIE